jgi:DNA-binding PadR family transcriptional regulator
VKLQIFHILLAVADESRHGSGIVRAVLHQTDGKLRLWPATLYGALEELTGMGWLEEVTDPAQRPRGESERKRFYRITSLGARVLADEAERLRALGNAALATRSVERLAR